jgi:hypothetical protein
VGRGGGLGSPLGNPPNAGSSLGALHATSPAEAARIEPSTQRLEC